MKHYVGIDLGGTNIAAGVMDETGKLVHTDSVKTLPERGPGEILADMAGLVEKVVADAGLSMDRIAAVGMGSPGIADNVKGLLVYSSNLPFRSAPVRAYLSGRLGVPVYLANDAGCAALAESRVGAAKGLSHAAVITIGTGIGCGIVIHGKIYHGFNNAAGEFGHSVILPDGEPCPCGRKGCFEMYASATALIRETRRAIARRPDSLMKQMSEEAGKVSARTAFDAMRLGDPAAVEIVNEYIRMLAEGITNLVNTLMPDAILIGGGVSNEGETILNPLREFVENNAYYGEGVPHVRIDRAILGNKAGMIGAAFMAMDSIGEGIGGC